MSWFIPGLFHSALSSHELAQALQFNHDKCTYLLCRYNTPRKQAGNISPSLIRPDPYLFLSNMFPVTLPPPVWLSTCFLPSLCLSAVYTCGRAGCCSAVKCAFTFYLPWGRPKRIIQASLFLSLCLRKVRHASKYQPVSIIDLAFCKVSMLTTATKKYSLLKLQWFISFW